MYCFYALVNATFDIIATPHHKAHLSQDCSDNLTMKIGEIVTFISPIGGNIVTVVTFTSTRFKIPYCSLGLVCYNKVRVSVKTWR